MTEIGSKYNGSVQAQKVPLDRYRVQVGELANIFIKHNFFIDHSGSRLDPDIKKLKKVVACDRVGAESDAKADVDALKDYTPMTDMEVVIIQLAFSMANQLNQVGENYNANTDFEISVKNLAKILQIDDKDMHDGSLHTKIRRALKRVDARRFNYPSLVVKDGDVETNWTGLFAGLRFVTSLEHGSFISFNFPKYLIPYLQAYGSWTWYYFASYVSLHKYVHASILYEILARHKNTPRRINKNTIELKLGVDKLRQALSISAKYNITDIVRKILNPAIERINALTQTYVEPIDKNVHIAKKGREIDSIIFKVTYADIELDFDKAIGIENDKKPFMRPKQISSYSYKLCNDVGFRSLMKRDGEDDHAFLQRIATDLECNLKVLTYIEHLKRVGFRSTRVNSFISKKKSNADDETVVEFDAEPVVG